jgi:tRNA (adenine57-N1/adenine58-N1)-methyltransferase catalytic subunit
MITRILVDKNGDYLYQHDRKDVSSKFGMVKAAVINDAPDGAEVISNTHEKFILLTPTFLDQYRRLERGPQIMMLKDLGVVAAETGMGAESIVGDAGTGSGAAALYFARIAKHVYSYDVVQEHHEIGKRNATLLGTTNVTFAVHDVYESIPNHEFDVFVLDNPEPWRALAHYESVKIGGWFVAYIPSVNQAAAFANAVQEMPQLQYRKTVELMERHWAIKGTRVRPSSDAVGHTGFLVYARRIR